MNSDRTREYKKAFLTNKHKPEPPRYIVYQVYNIKKLGNIVKNKTFNKTGTLIEINFDCTETTTPSSWKLRPFKKTVTPFKTLFKVNKIKSRFQTPKYTLDFILNEIENVSNKCCLLLTLRQKNNAFGDLDLTNAHVGNLYGFEIFKLRACMNSVDDVIYNKKELDFYPSGVNYLTTTNYISPLLGLEPRRELYYNIEHYRKTKLKFLTHLKNIKRLNERCMVRLTQNQYDRLFTNTNN